MIELYLRSLLLAALGLLASFVTRRRSASVRHLVALAGLASMLALPLLGGVVPPARLPILPSSAIERTAPFTVRLEPAPAAIPEMTPEPAASPQSFPWPLLWPLGSLVLLLRWAFGWAWLAVLLRRAKPIGDLDSVVPVVESESLGVPLVAWTPRARVVLPPGWHEWSAARLDIVLRHETAHVRRGDGWGLLVARLAVALFWPNPFVWPLARAEARLAERATDDLVVAEGVSATHYAHELLALVRNAPASGVLPALGMARKAQLSQRVEMILRTDLPRASVSRRARSGAAFAALALALPVATFALDHQTAKDASNPLAFPLNHAFHLHCEIVRTDRTELHPAFLSTPRPDLSGAKILRSVGSSDFDVRSGTSAALKVTLDGVVHTLKIKTFSGEMLSDLAVEPTESAAMQAKASRLRSLARVTIDDRFYGAFPSEWVRYPFLDALGKPTGYQMLVQVTPNKSEGSVSSPDISSDTPAKDARQAAPPARASVPLVLRGKVVRTDDPGHDPVSHVMTEPTIGDPNQNQIVSTPTILTRAGASGRIDLTGGNLNVSVRVAPTVVGQDRYRLAAEVSVGPPGATPAKAHASAILRAREWLRLRLTDAKGGYSGYQFFVQLVPSAGE